jgi:hypothetical protein
MNKNTGIDSKLLEETLTVLNQRIEERFPKSGLGRLCVDINKILNNTKEQIKWIVKPHLMIRIVLSLIFVIGVVSVTLLINGVNFHIPNSFELIVSLIEAIFNIIFILGAVAFYLVSIETKYKRKKAVKSINKLRSLLHVVDMHQLSKDPNMVDLKKYSTQSSPERILSKFELFRYLNYCSEIIAIISKISTIYAQEFEDEIVIETVNDIEILSTGLNQKIWQKINILQSKKL